MCRANHAALRGSAGAMAERAEGDSEAPRGIAPREQGRLEPAAALAQLAIISAASTGPGRRASSSAAVRTRACLPLSAPPADGVGAESRRTGGPDDAEAAAAGAQGEGGRGPGHLCDECSKKMITL